MIAENEKDQEEEKGFDTALQNLSEAQVLQQTDVSSKLIRALDNVEPPKRPPATPS